MNKFIAHWSGVALFALMNGTFAWLLLDWRFHLGFFVWFLIAAVGVQLTRSGLLMNEYYEEVVKSLTRKRR